jgi:hypothetical protein
MGLPAFVMVAVVLRQLLLKTCNSYKILSTEKHPGNGMHFYLGVSKLKNRATACGLNFFHSGLGWLLVLNYDFNDGKMDYDAYPATKSSYSFNQF